MLMNYMRRFLPYVFLALLVLLGAGFWVKHEQVLDWVATRGYMPSDTVNQLVVDTEMTPYGKQLFFANRPVVEGKDSFNKHCTDPSEQVAVLGCYTGDRRGIYLFDVTDSRLTGIEQVTAAHELLHQAYDRLNGAERTRINGLLQEYHDLTATQALKAKIASYKHSEPKELQNEMHSIFATEAAELPAELEEYYTRYFANRKKIVAYHAQYQAEFDKRHAQIEAYDKQLATMKTDIENHKESLKDREAELEARREQLDGYLAANQIATYNAAVPGFNALVVSYRAELQATNHLVDQFNQILGERNDIAVQERQLEEAIDSHVTPAEGQ
jgi:hypothetical protein